MCQSRLQNILHPLLQLALTPLSQLGKVHGISFTQKAGNLRWGKGEKLPGICPGSTTIVAPKSVWSRTTNGQMKAISQGEFNGFPGRRDGPNHADRLNRASGVLSAGIPRKKPQAKKSPLSVETAYEPTPSEASQKTKPAQNIFQYTYFIPK